ncbi:MAG: carboxypeptidase regulatory-like domain-containing protein [Acidobacteria bacterium]|nr:carboxypeptidase regulatory-like domain-containing protein [Acidobacteriota bacterium]
MQTVKASLFVLLGLLLLAGCASTQENDILENKVPGTAMLTGTVTAPTAFQAARVYARNTDKNIIYMVYTGEGRYQAVALFPGPYEVWVEKSGFESDRQEIQIEAGEVLNVDFSLREAAPQSAGQGTFMGLERGSRAKDALLLPYDELYPEAPIRSLMEKTCIQCHGQSFLPFFHKSTGEWDEAIGTMLESRIPPGTIDSAQRKELAQYLSSHFGPDSPDRYLKMDVEIPLDETALSKAQYVEFILPLDKGRSRRWLQEVHIDFEGSVWYTERIAPHAVGRVDPRTGQIDEWVLPDPEADPHGLTVDSEGWVYWAESKKEHLGRLNPKTGETERFSFDETGTLGFLGGHTPVLDSQENVWSTIIRGDALAKWDRETHKVQIWRVPTQFSMPYGLDLSPDDIPVLAELYGCKVAVFNPETEEFTEYPALVEPPCKTRRLGIDSKGIIWYGVFSQGKLGKLDLKTGEQVEYDMASRFAEPYSVRVDRNTDTIWISDGGMGGALVRFNPETEEFTYYPTPRRSDMPKIDVSGDGNVWYSTRSLPDGGIGVLYPDKSKIETLAIQR